jgi:hypothetical protein
MVRYFYVWTPLVIAGTVVLVTLPWLGLIALFIFSLAAAAALASAIVLVPYVLGWEVGFHWHAGSGASPWTVILAPRQPTPEPHPHPSAAPTIVERAASQ